MNAPEKQIIDIVVVVVVVDSFKNLSKSSQKHEISIFLYKVEFKKYISPKQALKYTNFFNIPKRPKKWPNHFIT